jgi:acetyl-CoA C-acetyltransferase
VSAPRLGATAIAAALARAKLEPADVEEVFLGNVLSAGIGQAPARQASLLAQIPQSVPTTTVGKVCGSGLQAAILGTRLLRLGEADIVVAGGMESMSNVPYYLTGYRDGVKFGNRELVDGLIHDGLWCAFDECHMGGHAEYTAWKAGITREDADAFALESHRRAIAAIDGGCFREEIAPVSIEGRKGTTVVDTDEPPRRDSSAEAMAKLKPAFVKDAPSEVTNPVVTAGNAPGLNDGAAALVVTSEEYAKAHGLNILARVSAYANGAVAPRELFFAPVRAVRKVMEKEGKQIDDYDLFEVNEAFAVQALADGRELGMDWSRVNVNGGAVALGHPIGASGSRILVTLLHAMKQRDAGSGIATLCLGGGDAVALSVERV